MNPINFIDNLSFSADGILVSAGSNRRNAEIFMRQGDLDSACAIYSLMMMLIINNRVNRKDLVSRDKKRGYTSIKRLQDEFLAGLPGLYKEGYFFNTIKEKLCSSFKKVASAETFTTLNYKDREDIISKSELHKKIKETLESGFPVQIGFSYKGGRGGHAVVAIGFQELQNKLRLFCLDPAYNLAQQAFWNTIIDINLEGNLKSTYQDNYYSGKEKSVSVDEILIIK